MTDNQRSQGKRPAQTTRVRQQRTSRSRGDARGQRANKAQFDPVDEPKEDFREDAENEASSSPTHDEPISRELKSQLDTVCEEASAALRTRDTEAARNIFRERVKPQLRIFYHGSHGSLYCLLLAVYLIGNRLKRYYGRETRTPMYKAIVGDVHRTKTYMEVLKRCISIPEQDPQRKLVQTRLSGYNCALEQAYREALDQDQLIHRLSKDGGIDRLLKDGRERSAKKKGGKRVKGHSVSEEAERTVPDASADQDGSFDQEEETVVADRGASSRVEPYPITGTGVQGPARKYKALNPSFEIADEATRTIACGQGRYVAIIDVARTRPLHVTIKLAQSLPHHDRDNDEQALDRMITSVRSSKSKN